MRRLFKRKIGILMFILGASSAFSQMASAYTVYLLANNYYAIVCTDGQIFSYSGGPSGVGIVAPALCEGHGGIAGGSGGVMTATKASPAIARVAKSCLRGSGRKIDKSTTQCKTKIRVNRIEMARSSKG